MITAIKEFWHWIMCGHPITWNQKYKEYYKIEYSGITIDSQEPFIQWYQDGECIKCGKILKRRL